MRRTLFPALAVACLACGGDSDGGSVRATVSDIEELADGTELEVLISNGRDETIYLSGCPDVPAAVFEVRTQGTWVAADSWNTPCRSDEVPVVDSVPPGNRWTGTVVTESRGSVRVRVLFSPTPDGSPTEAAWTEPVSF